MNLVALAFVTVFAFASTGQAEVVWRGGFEDGTRSEFARYHAVEATPHRINVVTKPVADGLNTTGAKAARVEVRTGDNGRKLDPTTGRKVGNHVYRERAELAVPTNVLGHDFFREGDDIWVTWQTMFPSDKWWGEDLKGGGTVFFQFHHVKLSNDTFDGSPPLMFSADNEQLRVVQCVGFKCPATTELHSAPILFDHWYTFVLHAKHSSKTADGEIQLWINGEPVVDTQAALLFGADFGNYILAGQYRRPNTPKNSVLYMDNFVIGTTKEDVMPEPVKSAEPDSIDPEAPEAPDSDEENAFNEDTAQPLRTDDQGFLFNDDVRFEPGTSGCSQTGAAFLMLAGLAGLGRRRRKTQGR